MPFTGIKVGGLDAHHRSVGPEIVRELVGALERVGRHGRPKSRGMIITTSTLTAGAVAEAAALAISVVDGPCLAAEMQEVCVKDTGSAAWSDC